ncbi:hypothetical protein BD324DRAFT_648320 [Kockovaella imperatae]|uniref:Uncharacterized protein n=1 Tax=Kockovaella imperatae TaxID=4999 RepID=A0A1Y1UNU9_9TREE|nr:hypothetical protein BD324DRAFT_648320 [Kockovaella imperatae]ORX39689.1 hypothetical protein BD324DRAFT_648320 [Kockovaella imperatae]
MWPYYPSPRRKSSGSTPSPSTDRPAASPAFAESPQSIARTIHSSPVDSPHLNHRPSLTRVDEDTSRTSSQDEPVVRDYAPGVGLQLPEQDTDHRTQQTHSDSFIYISDTDSASAQDVPTLQRPPQLHRRSSPKKASAASLPPATIHDDFLSKFITPLSLADDDRPGLERSASAPGIAGSPLQPSPLSIDPSSLDGKPIFDIFNANISPSAEEMVKVLKGHLEGVLRVQEEIGRLHISLEKVGEEFEAPQSAKSAGTSKPVGTPQSEQSTPPRANRSSKAPTPSGASKGSDPDDTVAKREKGVEDIMDRLGQLSERLRAYHALGTPQLSFPKSGNTPNPSGKQGTTLDPLSANMRRSNSRKDGQTFSPLRPSPLRQVGEAGRSTSGLAGKRSSSTLGLSSQGMTEISGTVTRESTDTRSKRLSLEEGQAGSSPSTERRSRGDEAWYEHMRPRSRGPGSPNALEEEGYEMFDRSRPW